MTPAVVPILSVSNSYCIVCEREMAFFLMGQAIALEYFEMAMFLKQEHCRYTKWWESMPQRRQPHLYCVGKQSCGKAISQLKQI